MMAMAYLHLSQRRLVGAAAIGLMALLLWSGLARPEEDKKPTKAPEDEIIVQEVDVDGTTVGAIIEALMRDLEDVNFQITEEAASRQVGRILLRGMSLRKVLNRIAKASNVYWERDEDGVFIITTEPPKRNEAAAAPKPNVKKAAAPPNEADGEAAQEDEEEPAFNPPAKKRVQKRSKKDARQRRQPRYEEDEELEDEIGEGKDEEPLFPRIVSEEELVAQEERQPRHWERIQLKFIHVGEAQKVLGLPVTQPSPEDFMWRQVQQKLGINLSSGGQPMLNEGIGQRRSSLGLGLSIGSAFSSPPSVVRNQPLQGFGGFGGGGFGGFGGGGFGGFGGGGFGGFGGGGGGLFGGGGGQANIQIEGLETIIAHPPTNSLIVRGTPEAIRELQEIIDLLDIPPVQIELEAQFVALSRDDQRALGIAWFTAGGDMTLNVTGTIAPDVQIGFVRGNLRASLGTALFSGRGKIINAPRLVTQNNQPAILFSALIEPLFVESGTTDQFGNFIKTTDLIENEIPVLLFAIPRVNADKSVTVFIVPFIEQVVGAVAVPGGTGGGGGTISKTVSTGTFALVTVPQGQSFAIGGLTRSNVARNITKVPLLADLPFIGSFFRNRTISRSENELILFVTPRVIEPFGTVAPQFPQGG